MLVLVTYDVSTMEKAGRNRLRKVAEYCSDYGRRVQCSVFECHVDPGQWERLKHNLLDIIDDKEDSLRFYFLGSNWKKRIEHHGLSRSIGVDDIHIV